MTQTKLQRGASLCRTILQGGLQEEKNDNKIEPTMQEITNTQNSFFKGIKYRKCILLKQAVLISKFSGGGWGDWKKKKPAMRDLKSGNGELLFILQNNYHYPSWYFPKSLHKSNDFSCEAFEQKFIICFSARIGQMTAWHYLHGKKKKIIKKKGSSLQSRRSVCFYCYYCAPRCSAQ